MIDKGIRKVVFQGVLMITICIAITVTWGQMKVGCAVKNVFSGHICLAQERTKLFKIEE